MQGRTRRGLRQALNVGIVGGSLGGLTAALVLRDLGCEVEVAERSTAELESRGAGIVVLPETSRYLSERTNLGLDAVTTSTTVLRYLDGEGTIVYESPRHYRYSGWHTIYRALLDSLGRERYHVGREVTAIDAQGATVVVGYADGGSDRFDLVVCADGIGSGSRARLLPDVRPAYAGYVAWRGTVAETELPPWVLSSFRDALVYEVIADSHILLYPIPAHGGATEPGERLLNFVWYRNYEGAELEDLMTDRDGVRREVSLPPGAARAVHVDELRAFAQANLAPPIAEVVAHAAAPFAQVIFDVDVPRMAFGRVCLIGDAAFVVRPHIAAGTAKAAADAWALADVLASSDKDVERALLQWEARQLAVGRAALERARRNGDRSQVHGTWTPGDPDLDYGLTSGGGADLPRG
ncbi:MAG: FAD binding domain-containing protein [Actinomycetota bacterium]